MYINAYIYKYTCVYSRQCNTKKPNLLYPFTAFRNSSHYDDQQHVPDSPRRNTLAMVANTQAIAYQLEIAQEKMTDELNNTIPVAE